MFFKRKKNAQSNANQNTWMVYRDMLGEAPISIRVDTSFVKKRYQHTLYVIVPYQCNENKPFPDEKELAISNQVEDKVDELIKDYPIEFVGSATFNGLINLIYVSNDDIEWEKLIQVDTNVQIGKYENDQMGYYNQVLYPPYVRKKR